MKKALILIVVTLLLTNIYQAAHIIRLEKYHYASQLNYCQEIEELITRDRCLNETETRKNRIYHLLYGLELM
jgi:hypothetical protein